MKTYARIDNGVVAEVIRPRTYDEDGPIDPATGYPKWTAGDEIPISDRYHPDFVALLVDVTGDSPQPQEGEPYSFK
ncbi:hypothetical protein [Burkholderia multivorans]|uniref:hypothetical protein n=1 Tax=Burkholderia multivorans TaxID=87883 RepID=UPI0011B27930|nr:hypothetical protein [Burkholderia multivorans]